MIKQPPISLGAALHQTFLVRRINCHGCGHLYNGEVSRCDCSMDSKGFTPVLAYIVELK